ncbi:FUSC family membrane protein [Pseudogulbenkiania sp. MAI-1]|uniref:FUSC family protein n=1 Tax=Pseudogulbenkiania sp. MAI-1 TaxID=990370 RepID=UPI00045E77B5|nr:FUSC family membrane protein [Pseudogulbenkiania sp. MAI-1]
MQIPSSWQGRARALLRIALSYYVANGLSAALGLMLISGGVHLFLGAAAASAASVGVIVCIPPDLPGPKRGKFFHLLPAALIGLPLFFGVQALHASPGYLGLLLVPASFIAFLAAAWGKRGLPISISVMFAMVFSMAAPEYTKSGAALTSTLYFALGAGLYLVYATIAHALLNPLYRVQMLADTLLTLGELMRTQAQQFATAGAGEETGRLPLIGRLLKQQAALADHLQSARDLLLESPRTPRRQQLAGMLMLVLELRDHLLACELDLDTLKTHPGHEPLLDELRGVLETLAGEVEQLADALLYNRLPEPLASLRPRLAALHWGDETAPPASAGMPSPAMLARGLANRIGHINDEVLRLIALARGEAEPDLAVVRAAWQMFVSPTAWSWRPFAALWRWDAPPLRHAIRAALAIGTAYALSLVLPWGTHDYWILLTIVVVLRGSLAQTLERRNSRVAGTLMGCVLAGALLAAHVPPLGLLVVVTLAQAVAHAFTIRRYLVTAVAATVLGLVQAHMLSAGASPAFAMVERMADTLIGVTIAWLFSYVLPSWERHQIPALVRRTLAAQARHARVALGLGQLQAVDNEPELAWRLARREAYDSLSALVQATQRSLSEPRAVRPPLRPLSRLMAHSYQLLAQLTAVKTMLLLRRDRLNLEQIRPSLQQNAELIGATLTGSEPAASADSAREEAAPGPVALPDPFEHDLSLWLLRRLDLASDIAVKLREEARQVLGPLAR